MSASAGAVAEDAASWSLSRAMAGDVQDGELLLVALDVAQAAVGWGRLGGTKGVMLLEADDQIRLGLRQSVKLCSVRLRRRMKIVVSMKTKLGEDGDSGFLVAVVVVVVSVVGSLRWSGNFRYSGVVLPAVLPVP